MPHTSSDRQPISRAVLALALLVLGAGLSGCADMSDSLTSAFADPATFELYDCKQLEPIRKSQANRLAELQGLMAKAETGFAGPVVAELAYRNEYIAVRGQSKNVEEIWRRNKCVETKPEPKPEPKVEAAEPVVRGAKSSKSGGAIH